MDDVRILDLDAPRRGTSRTRLAILLAIAVAVPVTSGTFAVEVRPPEPERSELSAAVTEAYKELRRDRSAAARQRAFTGWAAH